MPIISIILIGEEEECTHGVEVQDELTISHLKTIIQKITSISPIYQQIQINQVNVPDTEKISLNTGDQLHVKHVLMKNWVAYSKMIKSLEIMTQSGETSGRRQIALNARKQLSPLHASDFFIAFPSLALKELTISNNLRFLVHNCKKYLRRSALKYFQELNPNNLVETKNKPNSLGGIHVGVFVLLDGVATYYVKTMGQVPGENDDFENRPRIDLIEIFVYFLLKNVGLGPEDVHLIPDINNKKLVYLGTKIIPGFRTAFGDSIPDFFGQCSSEEKARIVVSSAQKYEMKVFSSIFCLNDILRNRGNHGIVSYSMDARKAGTESNLKIVDFGIDNSSIDDEPNIFESSTEEDFNVIKCLCEKWNVWKNIEKSRVEVENHGFLKNTDNVNHKSFQRYLKRLSDVSEEFCIRNQLSSSKMSELKQGVGIMETILKTELPLCDTFERISIDNFPIFALGKEISKRDGIDAMKKYMTSRFWFTYRRDFLPIGGTGPTSDQGWGCMLRCAQMLLGEVLLRRHIGRHFEWDIENTSEDYEKILQMFFDEKDALYSIHQIAQMGVTEGKEVSKWFGPNTAAQVIKKLTIFDNWSNIAVHVALDNILVKQDALTMATTYPSEDAVKLIMENGQIEKHRSLLPPGDVKEWRPLLLMIPLRLGLTSINTCYLPAIQEFFKLPQCVGIIGGKPNLAHYFVGIAGTKLFYLDPHYCPPKTSKVFAEKDHENPVHDTSFSELEDLEPLPSQTSDVYTKMDDSTYHCQMMQWMEYESIDPSLALALFCETRDDFENLCVELQNATLPSSKPPMFEFLEKRPKYLPKFEPYTGVSMKIEMKEFDDIGAANVKIDDDFEVLEVKEEEEF